MVGGGCDAAAVLRSGCSSALLAAEPPDERRLAVLACALALADEMKGRGFLSLSRMPHRCFRRLMLQGKVGVVRNVRVVPIGYKKASGRYN